MSGSFQRVTRAFFKNVLFETEEDDLRKLFETCGKVQHLELWRTRDNRFKGAGTVEYSTPEEAEKAVRTLSNFEIDGRTLTIDLEDPDRAREGGMSKGKKGSSKLGDKGEKGGSKRVPDRGESASEGAGDCKVLFANVPFDTAEPFVKGVFKKHGRVVDFDLWKMWDGRSRGMGIVEYSTPEEAQEAVRELLNFEVDDRTLYVALADQQLVQSHCKTEDKDDKGPHKGGGGVAGTHPKRSSSKHTHAGEKLSSSRDNHPGERRSSSKDNYAGKKRIAPFAAGWEDWCGGKRDQSLARDVWDDWHGDDWGGDKWCEDKHDSSFERTVFFKNVAPETTASHLMEMFKDYGSIERINMWKMQDRRSGGIGTVEYSSRWEAEDAVRSLWNLEVDGRPLFVSLVGPEGDAGLGGEGSVASTDWIDWYGSKGRGGPRRLFFHNVLFETTAGYLRGVFKQHGYIVDFDLWRTPDGRSRGCGIVEYSSGHEASAAMRALAGYEVDGRPLMLKYEDPAWAEAGRANDYDYEGDVKGSRHGQCIVAFRNASSQTPASLLVGLFARHGCVKEFNLWMTTSGNSKGAGTVEFSSPWEARAAAAALNGTEVDGRKLWLEVDDQGDGVNPCKLVFENLLCDTPGKFLEGLFSRHGRIIDFRLFTGPGGRPGGAGTVEFSTPSAARSALAALDGAVVDGRTMRVEFAESAKARVARGDGGWAYDWQVTS